jgi:SAM-dependent methyltransferase
MSGTRDLRTPEAVILVRHAAHLSANVLELGCGRGRLTGHLLALGATVVGLESTPALVDYCRTTYPAAGFLVRNPLDLRGLEPGYDAVVVGPDFDALEEDGGTDVLAAARELLVPGGIVVMASRNLHPARPRSALRLPRLVRVGRRAPAFRHAFRETRERQLADLGYELLDCVDEEGRVVRRGEPVPAHAELHLVARRVD